MFLKILFSLAVALEFVFVPLFLKYSWPKKCWKSFWLKMVCSALFFSAGLLAVKISGNNSRYAMLILWGLALGWVGDLFLHLITDKIWVFGIGLFAFLGGHIFYIAAFQTAIYATYPQAPAFAWYEFVAVAALVGAVILFAVIKKVGIKTIMAVPVVMYAITISFMLVKAFRYTIGEWAYGMNRNMVWLFIMVALGAVLFVLSDGSLGLLLFAGQGQNRPLKIFNIATYFAAQILLASSIFIIETPVLYGS